MYLSSLLHETGKAGESVGRAGEELPGFPLLLTHNPDTDSNPLSSASSHSGSLIILLDPNLDCCSFLLASNLRPQGTNPGSEACQSWCCCFSSATWGVTFVFFLSFFKNFFFPKNYHLWLSRESARRTWLMSTYIGHPHLSKKKSWQKKVGEKAK